MPDGSIHGRHGHRVGRNSITISWPVGQNELLENGENHLWRRLHIPGFAQATLDIRRSSQTRSRICRVGPLLGVSATAQIRTVYDVLGASIPAPPPCG